MSDDVLSILPSHASKWMRAVEQVSGKRWQDLDVDIIRRARDPWTCPEHLLPHLAYQRSVDVWDERWPLEKKRQVIADAPEDHHLKTTLDGIERYLRHAGATLLRATTPPQGVYPIDGLTAEERAAWLARLDQVRIHRHYPIDAQGDGVYADASCWDEAFFDVEPPNWGYRKHAVLRRPDGTEINLDVVWQEIVTESGESTEVESIVLPAKPDSGFYLGESSWDVNYYDTETTRERTITVTTPGAYSYQIGRAMFGADLPPGLMSGAVPELVSEVLPGDGVGVMADAGCWDESFWIEDRSWQHVYERIYLADPDAQVPSMDAAGSYWDDAWYDWPPYTALLQVRQEKSYGVTGAETCWDEGFYIDDDLADYDVTLSAVASAKALRDKVLISTTTYRLPNFGDRLRLDGSWRLGQLIEDR